MCIRDRSYVMSKKIVAFSGGRKNGNTEIYIKTALLEAKKMGVEVELIRLSDCNLLPCKACSVMPCMPKGPAGCIIKDDAEWLLDKFLESDGYILGAPVWSLSPCGVVTDLDVYKRQGYRNRTLDHKITTIDIINMKY